MSNEVGTYSMAGTRSKSIVEPEALYNEQLKNILEKEIKRSKKKYMTNLYGLEFGKSLKNKDKSCSPPLKHIAWGYIAHKIAPAVWTFDAPLKKKQSVSFLSTSISYVTLKLKKQFTFIILDENVLKQVKLKKNPSIFFLVDG